MTTEEIISKYVNDPTTKVFISYNNETEDWLYSVVVDNSCGFWLDSFKTETAAIDYVRLNNLVLV